MNLIDLIGTFAGILTSISMIPQLIKVLKEKKVEDVSLLMLIVLLLGVCLWVVYGIMKEEWPIILSNGFSVLVNTILLIYYFIYSKKH